MKKFSVVLIALVVLFAGYYVYTTFAGPFSGMTVDYAQSDLYSNQDIDAAIAVVKDEFKHFLGGRCKMTAIRYVGDEEAIKELERLGHANYDACMVLASDFHTPKFDSEAFEPDREYKNWKWILCRKSGGDWLLVGYGYA